MIPLNLDDLILDLLPLLPPRSHVLSHIHGRLLIQLIHLLGFHGLVARVELINLRLDIPTTHLHVLLDLFGLLGEDGIKIADQQLEVLPMLLHRLNRLQYRILGGLLHGTGETHHQLGFTC